MLNQVKHNWPRRGEYCIIQDSIDLLEKFGPKLGTPHVKKISGSLFELRISGGQEVRIFYSFHKSQIFLLHGFIKKTQKIPWKEIKIAFQKQKLLDTV